MRSFASIAVSVHAVIALRAQPGVRRHSLFRQRICNSGLPKERHGSRVNRSAIGAPHAGSVIGHIARL